jgi:hypothetical protein
MTGIIMLRADRAANLIIDTVSETVIQIRSITKSK